MSDLDPRLLDFRNFLYLAWQHLDLPEPNSVQYDIAHFMQYGCSPEERAAGDPGTDRKGILAFRGAGKSWLNGVECGHDLYHDYNARLLVASASAPRAKKFTYFVRRLIREWPLLAHLRPRHNQRDSDVDGFDIAPAPNAQAPSCMAMGITGQLTGARATHIIGDDIEIPTNSDTITKREILSERVKEFESVLSPGGRITYLGTPQSAESIYVNTLANRGYRFRIWPARVPTKKKAEQYGAFLAPMIKRLIADGVPAGTPVEPIRFSEDVLIKKELGVGKSTFALQFQLDTELSDAEKYPLRCSDFSVLSCRADVGPVKLAWASSSELTIQDLPVMGFTGDRWFRPMFVARDFTEWNGVVMTIDPSGRGKDELAYSVVKMLNGNLFLAECKGMTGGYTEENLKALAVVAKRHKVKHIRIESNFGDGMFTALLQPVLSRIYPVTVEEVRHNVQKERRIIDTLEPVLNQHRLVVDPEVIREDHVNYNEHSEEVSIQYSLMYQLTHITKDRGSLIHDDRLDSLAMAVAYWVEVMGKDDHNAMVKHKQEKFDRELEDYYRAIGVPGGLSGGDNWIT
jgi:hypothetical protein